MSAPDRRAMIERPGKDLSVRRRCALVGVARSAVYRPKPVARADDLAVMRRIDELHLSRAVLAWRLSNTNDASFCAAALEEALLRFGKPRIFNTDQGSTFTAEAFAGKLAAAGVSDFDGRTRPFHGQHFHRTAVALDQV